MRLEGAPREEWEPRIESARQTFKQLAGDASGAARQEAQEDLESAIRLARMDLSELQGLPLPSQCQGCGSGRGRGSKQKSTGKKPKDARGASSGPPPDGSGS